MKLTKIKKGSLFSDLFAVFLVYPGAGCTFVRNLTLNRLKLWLLGRRAPIGAEFWLHGVRLDVGYTAVRNPSA